MTPPKVRRGTFLRSRIQSGEGLSMQRPAHALASGPQWEPVSEPASFGQPSPNPPTVFMVGNSPAMLEVFEHIRRFAACGVPVLITGESGTGKELVARAIHDRSSRAEGPFVALNCAAVPPTLIASELFGYEKGAFTGAATRKHGHVEHAHRGTLFLDEIGDMPIDLQGLLLRFLQEGEILRVGGRQPIKVDVRVVAATNVRLREAIEAGKLREDLYYRLNVLTIDLPPLRERHGDVEVLATYFLREIARELNRDLPGFTPEAMAAVLAYPWPGNVRELIATIRRAVVLANGPLIGLSDLRLEPVRLTRSRRATDVPQAQSDPSPKNVRSSSSERDAILQALDESRFNVTRAARSLGVSRATLYRMLHRNRIVVAQRYRVADAELAAGED
jgi:transcriptional regulator with PAS, ATPase and Fis domain